MRIVVKIGTSLLTDESGALDRSKIDLHVKELAAVKDHEIVLVTSGSIASGFRKLGYSSRPKDLVAKQACAAAGQSLLIATYSEEFAKYNLSIAQALLTRSDFSRRSSCRNATAALELLLKKKVIPVVNENDLVAVEEINFGDNDMLSALLSGLLSADLLVILTDQDGVFDQDPRENQNAKLLSEINEVDQKILAMAGSASSKFGKGGMYSKLNAARVANSLGVRVFIGSGRVDNHVKIDDVVNASARGSYITGESKKLGIKKQWLAFHAVITANVEVDSGAADALLNRGSSLLPVGVVSISGSFFEGDVLSITLAGNEIARGLASCASSELQTYLNSAKTIAVPAGELVHRDSLVFNFVEEDHE